MSAERLGLVKKRKPQHTLSHRKFKFCCNLLAFFKGWRNILYTLKGYLQLLFSFFICIFSLTFLIHCIAMQCNAMKTCQKCKKSLLSGKNMLLGWFSPRGWGVSGFYKFYCCIADLPAVSLSLTQHSMLSMKANIWNENI